MNGDWIMPPSSPRIGAPSGKISNATRMIATTKAIAAHTIPFFSTLVIFSNFSRYSPLYSPKRGSTTRSVTHVPINVRITTATIMNHQFIAMFIDSAYAGSITAAPAIVNSPSMASVPDKTKFALNPPETPANAAATPASGWRPIAANSNAPTGDNTTYPASEATLDITPAKTKPNVIKRSGTYNTKPRSNALIKPVRSATPIPSIVTITTPSGAKPMKLSVIFVNMYCIPSLLSKLLISTISPSSPGCSTLIPSGDKIADKTITANANIANNVTGCGNLFPNVSTPFRKRWKGPFLTLSMLNSFPMNT